MPKFYLRCKKCYKRKISHSDRPKKCSCGNKIFYIVKKTIKPVCYCSGYHFPHRVKSPCCLENPLYQLKQALREGVNKEIIDEIKLSLLFEGKFKIESKKDSDCPF